MSNSSRKDCSIDPQQVGGSKSAGPGWPHMVDLGRRHFLKSVALVASVAVAPRGVAQTVGTSPATASPQRKGQSFSIGYYQIHPDYSLNYQMNRFMTGERSMIDAMLDVAPKIHTYADYQREFLGLAEKALKDGRKLEGAYYLRSAEFFMFPTDEAKQPTRKRFMQLMSECHGITDDLRFAVPYESGTLKSFRFQPQQKAKGTIVMFGGYDSYIEEYFSTMSFFSDAGYDVISFEGPGQGAVLEDQHMPMTPEWDKPVKAVLDYFHLDDVTLYGISLGGCLVIRAAAHEPRARRVIADDIFSNAWDCIQRYVGLAPAVQTHLAQLFQAGEASQINALVEDQMQKSLVAYWGFMQGMLVMGAETPYEFIQRAKLYHTAEVSDLLHQDVLLLAGTEDLYVSLEQFYEQIRTLTSVRSLTARKFTREEQAQNHVHVGNFGLSLNVILNWLDSMTTAG
jgi:pimeloyl-ACP methyl ester carboxylesterase